MDVMDAHLTFNESELTPDGQLLWRKIAAEDAQTATVGRCLDAFAALRRSRSLAPGSLRASLRGSRLTFPQPPGSAPAASAEVLRRREYLSKQADRREYAKLTEAFNPKERERVSTLIPDLSIGANMITLGFTCFVLCYVGAGTVYSTVGERLVAGLCGLVGILLVEMVLFISRETKAEAMASNRPKNAVAMMNQKAKLA